MTRHTIGFRMLGASAVAIAGLVAGTVPSAASPNVLGITVVLDDGATAFTPQLPECGSLDVPGANPLVKGTGFSHASNVTITFDGATVGTVTSSSTGTFSKAIFIPPAKYGTHAVQAKDAHGVHATQLIRVSGFTCFSETGTTSLSVKWGVGGVDPGTAASIVFNNATVHSTTTSSKGGVSTTFTAPCQHGTTTWVVHVIQGGRPAAGQGTFSPTC